MTTSELNRYLRPCYGIAAALAGVGALSATIEGDFLWLLVFGVLVVAAALGYEWSRET